MKIIFDTEKEKDKLCEILALTNRCPATLNFSQLCDKNCSKCWKRAFRNMRVREKDYREEAEKMIYSGDVVTSKFYNILVDELAKQLKEDDKKKEVK